MTTVIVMKICTCMQGTPESGFIQLHRCAALNDEMIMEIFQIKDRNAHSNNV